MVQQQNQEQAPPKVVQELHTRPSPSTQVCFNCRTPGHYARDCAKRETQRPQCLYCGKKGHWQTTCWERRYHGQSRISHTGQQQRFVTNPPPPSRFTHPRQDQRYTNNTGRIPPHYNRNTGNYNQSTDLPNGNRRHLNPRSSRRAKEGPSLPFRCQNPGGKQI